MFAVFPKPDCLSMKMKKTWPCYPCAPDDLDSQGRETWEKRIDQLLDGFSKICSLLKWYVVVLLQMRIKHQNSKYLYCILASKLSNQVAYPTTYTKLPTQVIVFIQGRRSNAPEDMLTHALQYVAVPLPRRMKVQESKSGPNSFYQFGCQVIS